MLPFVALRLNEQISLKHTLKRLSNKTEIDEFVQCNNKTVIFFTEKYSDISFASLGVSLNIKNIKFAISGDKQSKEYRCSRFPCIVPFDNGEVIDLDRAPDSPIEFARWLKRVESPYRQKINNLEMFRLTLLSYRPFLLAVDLDELPATIPWNATVFSISSALLSKANITVEKGIYLYNTIERSITEFKENYNDLWNPNLVHPKGVRLLKRNFVAGYMYNPDDTTELSSFINKTKEIASNLNNSDSFYFTVLPANFENQLVIDSGVYAKAPPPYFFIFNTSDLFTKNRWISQEYNEMRNVSYISAKLERIANGIEPYDRISSMSEIDEAAPNITIITSITLNKYIRKDNDVLLAVTADWCPHCRKLKQTLNGVALLLQKKNITVASIDGDANELPEDFPNAQGYPTVFFFKGGEPSLYKGARDIDSILNYVAANATVPFDPSLEDDDAGENLEYPEVEDL